MDKLKSWHAGLILTGGGFEWDDDFSSPGPAFLSKIEKDPVSGAVPSTPPSAGRALQPTWSNSSSYSRFSISPANIASFSLTHLTDSDIEQGGKWSFQFQESFRCSFLRVMFYMYG